MPSQCVWLGAGQFIPENQLSIIYKVKQGLIYMVGWVLTGTGEPF